MKLMVLNRVTWEYKIGNKTASPKQWWYMAKHLIMNKRGCKVQDDNFLLMYEY
jgi:hypothetical protein